MECGQECASLIYEYFIESFEFQCFQFGDSLPSVESLCKKFSVADKTVKAALRQLREEGYISQQRGRPAKVIFNPSEEQYSSYISRFFSERWDACRQLFPTAAVFFQPLLSEAFKRLDEDDFVTLAEYANRAKIEDIRCFYGYLLNKLKNPLLMNLFWDFSLFLGFPHLNNQRVHFYDVQTTRDALNTILTLGKAQKREQLNDAMAAHWRSLTESAARAIEPYLHPVPAEEQLSFTWRIYRDRPQICYSLANRILHEIYLGRYRAEQFLPSYEKMAEDCGVSVNTIRRAVRLLTQFGVAQSINGKGTRIFTLGNPIEFPDFSVPAVRQHLAKFYQSYELLYYTGEEVTRSALSAMSEEERGMLAEQLRLYLRSGCSEIAPFSMLICLAMRAPQQGLREIYSKIYGLALWGYPLKAFGGAFPELEYSIDSFTEEMIQHLQHHDIDQCTRTYQECIAREFPATKKYFLHLGFTLEELETPSSILNSLPI